jgi:four helix bundle protein
MSHHRDLEVWKLGRALVKEAYNFSALLPQSETYGLRSQIQRAAISVPANIAEGCGRGTDPSFLQFIRIAIGSLNELETLVLLAQDVNLTSAQQAENLEASNRDLSVRLRNLSSRLESPKAIVKPSSAIVRNRARNQTLPN